jgi:hypothetical protein
MDVRAMPASNRGGVTIIGDGCSLPQFGGGEDTDLPEIPLRRAEPVGPLDETSEIFQLVEVDDLHPVQ